MYNVRFVCLFSENVPPALFAKLIRPSVAGQWVMSVPDNSLCSLFTRHDLLCSITGANPYQSGRDTCRECAGSRYGQGGTGENYLNWSSVTEMFYIDAEGRLQVASRTGPGGLIDRYGTMVRTYGLRPVPTVLPKQVVKSKAEQVPDEPTQGKTCAVQLQEMTRAERWRARKVLIAEGRNSLYPDARIAAKRVAANKYHGGEGETGRECV